MVSPLLWVQLWSVKLALKMSATVLNWLNRVTNTTCFFFDVRACIWLPTLHTNSSIQWLFPRIWFWDLKFRIWGLDIKHLRAHIHYYLATSMTDWAQIFTGLLFFVHVEIHWWEDWSLTIPIVSIVFKENLTPQITWYLIVQKTFFYTHKKITNIPEWDK